MSEQDFDSFEINVDKKTLGQLLKSLRETHQLEEHAEELIQKALTRRNFLAHRFFGENAERLSHTIARRQVIVEILNDISIFRFADAKLTPIFETALAANKINPELIQKYTENIVEKIMRSDSC